MVFRSVLSQKITAGLLACLFVATWAIRVGHIWADEHHHDGHPHCELWSKPHTSTETHIHDADYIQDDCSVCLYVFSGIELLVLPDWTLAVYEPFTQPKYPQFISTIAAIELLQCYLRGPPYFFQHTV